MDSLYPHAENGNTSSKRCTGPCERTLPATAEYFYRDKHKTDGLECRCKDCRNREKKTHQQRPEVQERRRVYLSDYHSRPEIQEHTRSVRNAYQSRPEIRERRRIMEQIRRSQPEIREQLRTRSLAYYHQHREHRRISYQQWSRRPEVQAQRKSYRKAYRGIPEVREHEQAYRKAYYIRPEAYELQLIRNRNRRARKKLIKGMHTVTQIQEQLKRQRYHCYYAACGHAKFEKKNGRHVFHVDHTFPISRVTGTDIPANDIGYLVLACPSCNTSKGDRYPWEWPEGGRLL